MKIERCLLPRIYAIMMYNKYNKKLNSKVQPVLNAIPIDLSRKLKIRVYEVYVRHSCNFKCSTCTHGKKLVPSDHFLDKLNLTELLNGF